MKLLVIVALFAAVSLGEEVQVVDDVDSTFCYSGNNCGYYDSADYMYASCGTTNEEWDMRDDYDLASQCAAVCEACDGCVGFEDKGDYCLYYEDFGSNWADWQFGCVLSTITYTEVICADYANTEYCVDANIIYNDGDEWSCESGCGTCSCDAGNIQTDYCVVDGECMAPTCEDVSGWSQSGNTCETYEEYWCDGTEYTSSHEPYGDDGTKASDSCCACGGGVLTTNELCPAEAEDDNKFTCSTWCDGCNTCGMESGEVTWCTRLYCLNNGDEFCMEYEDGTTSDCNCGSTCSDDDNTDDGKPKPSVKPKGGKGKVKKTPKKKAVKECEAACCMAMTSSCLSCAACQTEEEYCKENPTVSGC